MFDVAIVGGGPAGASAAIYTARAKVQTVLFHNGDSETQYAWLKNHYGIEDVDGPDLLDNGQHQAESFGAKIVKATVTNVIAEDGRFKLETSEGEFEAHYVIIATGESSNLVQKIGLQTEPAMVQKLRLTLLVKSKVNAMSITMCTRAEGRDRRASERASERLSSRYVLWFNYVEANYA